MMTSRTRSLRGSGRRSRHGNGGGRRRPICPC
jgi:hypothetical protein